MLGYVMKQLFAAVAVVAALVGSSVSDFDLVALGNLKRLMNVWGVI